MYIVHYLPENNSFLTGVCVFMPILGRTSYTVIKALQTSSLQLCTDITLSQKCQRSGQSKIMIRNWLGFECRPSPKQLMMACILFIICANFISFRVKLSKKCVF